MFIDKSTRRDRLGARTTVQLRGVVVVVSTWKANCVTTRADFREPAVISVTYTVGNQLCIKLCVSFVIFE